MEWSPTKEWLFYSVPQTVEFCYKAYHPPASKNYTYAVDSALKQHYELKLLVEVELFRFHRRNQQAGESLAKFMAELRLYLQLVVLKSS